MVTVSPAADRDVARRRSAALRELALIVGLYVAYSGIRMAVGGQWGAARRHADELLRIERAMHIDVEHWLNAVLTPIHWVSVPASYWYATLHFILTPVLLVVLYRWHPTFYRPASRALMAATLVALLGYYFYPTAPPRLTPGYVDTMLTTSSYGWWPSKVEQAAGSGSATNQVAAMPSMHVGWALWVSLVLAMLARRRWLKVLAFLYATTTTAVVVLTANHWILDAVAGAALVLVAWFGARLVYRGEEPLATSDDVGEPVLLSAAGVEDRPSRVA